MNKKIIILFMIIFFSFSIPCFASSWYWITQSSDGTQIYIDNDSVIKTGKVAIIWIKENNPDGSFETLRLVFWRYERLVMIKECFCYDSFGNTKESYIFPNKITSIPPDSNFDIIYRNIWQ